MRLKLALAAQIAVVPAIARAASPATEECVSASETAQQFRHDGRLRDARVLFAKCVVEACPAAVRADCIEQLAAVEIALPTIRFLGTTSGGERVAPLTISMDGQELVERDAANRYSVDPGEHLFTISAVGHETISKRFVVTAGNKSRDETVIFNDHVVPSSSPAVLGYATMGVGGVGVLLGTIFGFVSKSTYNDARSHCTTNSSFCDAIGVDEGQKAHTQATIATIGFVAGTAFIAGGIVIVLAPWRHDRTGQTELTMSGTGIQVLQSW